MDNKNLKQANIEWEPIPDDELFRFEKIGDTLEGKLIDIGVSEKYHVNMYTIELVTGDTKRILGKTQLDRRMKKVSMGQWVKISYIDDMDTPNGSMKIFEVFVAKKQR